MTNEQRILLDRLANAGHLIALGKDVSVAIGVALTDLAARDRRIAELEAALEKYGAHQPTCAYMQPGSGVGSRCFTANCDCGFDDVDEPAVLDALLAQARREALEAAADRAKDNERRYLPTVLSDATLRRMALEVKP